MNYKLYLAHNKLFNGFYLTVRFTLLPRLFKVLLILLNDLPTCPCDFLPKCPDLYIFAAHYRWPVIFRNFCDTLQYLGKMPLREVI